MNDSKLSVNQIIEAIKMLTTSEYNEFVSKLASLQRPEDSIDAYIEEPCELRKRNLSGKSCIVPELCADSYAL